MFRSLKSVSSRELVFLLKGFFLLGFSLGAIGVMCFFLLTYRKEDYVAAGVIVFCLLLALLINIMYRRIVAELSARLGA